MRLEGNNATRIHGTLVLVMSDGREGIIDVDLDISDKHVELRHDYEYDEELLHTPGSIRGSIPLATVWSIRIPVHLRDSIDPPFRITLPVR